MGIAADFVIIVLAGLAGAILARLLRLPLLVGYIAAGVLVGPYTAGPTVENAHEIELLAEIGVALLLFALGLEISFRDLQPVRSIALIGGPIQVLLSIAFGVLLGTTLLGLSLQESLWLGAMVALSSTMVVLKTLAEAGATSTLASRVMIGILVVQDLAVVPMLIILPQLANPENLAASLIKSTLLAAGFLVAMFFVGTRVLPAILRLIVRWGSRELFLVSVVAAGVGIGYLSHQLGLSFALGAFVAGIVLSESELSDQALSDIVPLRDVFGLLFFVSAGMLFDPAYLIGRWPQVLTVVLLILCTKALLIGLITRAFGYVNMAPFIVGLGLSQVGEFSFLIARSGISQNMISRDTYNLALTCTILTMSLSPLMSRMALPLGRWWRTRFGQAQPKQPVTLTNHQIKDHIVIAGLGRTGSTVARLMHDAGIPVLAIELNHSLMQAAQARGIETIFGDATRAEVLEAACIEDARALILSVPDNATTLLTVTRARSLNPGLHIIARATRADHVAELKHAGASVVVLPEFEGGVEMARQALSHSNVDDTAAPLIDAVRRELYRPALTPDSTPD